MVNVVDPLVVGVRVSEFVDAVDVVSGSLVGLFAPMPLSRHAKMQQRDCWRHLIFVGILGWRDTSSMQLLLQNNLISEEYLAF